MGFGDWISGAFSSVTHAITSVGGTVSHALSSAWDHAKSIANGAVKVVGQIGSKAYDAGKGIVNFAGKEIDKITTAGGNLAAGLGKAFSSPFIWIAAAVGGVVLLKMKSGG
jgi:phage-related protein